MRAVVLGRNRRPIYKTVKVAKKIQRGRRGVEQAITGQGEAGTKNEFGGAGVEVLLDRGAEAEEYPRQLVHPVRGGKAGFECLLQSAVKSFNHTIALRVVGGGGGELHSQGGGHGRPQG